MLFCEVYVQQKYVRNVHAVLCPSCSAFHAVKGHDDKAMPTANFVMEDTGSGADGLQKEPQHKMVWRS